MNLKFTYGKNAIVLLLICIFTSANAFSNQSNEKGYSFIKGKIIENEYKKPLEFAAISIYSLPDSSLIKGTISNKKGDFLLDELQTGTYFLKIEYMGYVTVSSKEFQLQNKEEKNLT